MDSETRRFTGQERDFESGLDYFGARHYSSGLGRFMTVDPSRSSASLSDPQTWNRFAYVTNNPLRYIDPEGLSRIKAIVKLVGAVHPSIRKEFKKFLKKSSREQRRELKSFQKSLATHEEKNVGRFSNETERIRMETELRERVMRDGIQANVDDIVKKFDDVMITGVGLGFGLSELAATGEAVEEDLGGGFLGTAAGIATDIVNPFGLVEDISFFAALIDAAAEYVSGPDNQRDEEEDSGSQ